MNRTIKVVKWTGFAVTLAILAWAFLLPNAGLLDRLSLAAKVGALFGSIYGYLKWRQEKKQSGLTDDAFTLKQAGGAEGLQKQASDARKVAIFFAALPFAAFLYGLSGDGGSLNIGLMLLSIVGLFCFPFAAFMLSQSSKQLALANKQSKRSIP